MRITERPFTVDYEKRSLTPEEVTRATRAATSRSGEGVGEKKNRTSRLSERDFLVAECIRGGMEK